MRECQHTTPEYHGAALCVWINAPVPPYRYIQSLSIYAYVFIYAKTYYSEKVMHDV